jgi:hypothetical protein
MAKARVRPYEDYYCDDPVRPAVKPKNNRSFLSVVMLIVAGLFLSNTFAANISLTNGGGVEFGQGISMTTACSGSQALTVTPFSSFINTSGAGSFYFSSIKVTNIPSSCNGTKFQFNAFTETGTAPLALYNTSSVDAIVGNNAGTFEAMGVTSGISVTTISSTSFSVTFTSPVALASNVSRLTIQSASATFASYAPARGIQFPSMSGLSLSSGIDETGNFTIEGWIRSADWSQTRALMPYVGNACFAVVILSLNATTWNTELDCQPNHVTFTMPSGSMANDQWIYWAYVKDSSGQSMFIDGVKLTKTSSNNGGSLALPLSATNDLGAIGEWYAYNTATNSSKNGIIGEIRLSNIARVASTSSSFNPSYASSGRPTAQLASDGNTTMLLRPPASGNTFVDSSGNQTLTVITTIAGGGTPTPPVVVNFG